MRDQVAAISGNVSSASRSRLAPPVARMTTTDSYATIRRWQVGREHHHHFTAAWIELQRPQYRGSVGSTSSRQRRIPPVKFVTRGNPASARCEAAARLRLPPLQ